MIIDSYTKHVIVAKHITTFHQAKKNQSSIMNKDDSNSIVNNPINDVSFE